MTHKHTNNFKPIIFWLILLGWLLVILFTWGCNPAKKIEREDNKAVQRVLGRYDLQVPIYNQWIKAHPQDTTTKIQYIKGETKIIEKSVRDTTREHFIKDSLIAVGKDCGEAAMNAFDLGYDQAEKFYLQHPRVDTLKIKTGVPTDMYNRMVDTAGMFAKQLNFELGKNEQLTQDKKDLNNKCDKLIMFVIIISSALVLSVIFNVRFLISPKKIINSIK